MNGLIGKFSIATLLISAGVVSNGFGQEVKQPLPDGTQGEVFREAFRDSSGAEVQTLRLNEFDGPLSSLKFGGGFLYEYAAYNQDDISKEQVSPENGFKIRDLRFTLSGKFKTQREITWKAGIMYDGNSKSWFMRETGVMFKMPELSGHIFIGRTKEGYSLSKVMNGYSIWNFERTMALDVIPILADGIKYMAYLPKAKVFYNVGAFCDWISEGQSFSTYDWQVVSRVAWLPVYTDTYKPVLHIGFSYKYGDVHNEQIKVSSKPEVSGAPNFVESGSLPSDYSNSFGGELYYRADRFLFGTEYHVHQFHSPVKGNPAFSGGEAFVSYMLTGEIKPYYTFNGIFGFIKVKRPVFKGGPGAVELLLRFSNMDIQDAAVEGGEFWRITPAVNWTLSDNVKVFLAYGYGILDRYEKEGATSFFQSRIMFLL